MTTHFGFSLSLILLVCFVSPAAGAVIRPIDAGGESSGELFILEAEEFEANSPSQTHHWEEVTSPKNFSGSSAMAALPGNGTRISQGYEKNSPGLTFKVDFTQRIRHYIWVRGYTTGNDNSLHLGLNQKGSATARNITLPVKKRWIWTNLTGSGQPAYLPVTAIGPQDVNIWMREDGLILDKVLLTTDPDFVPQGLGPQAPSTGNCQAPVLDPIGVLYWQIGPRKSFPVSASDPDTAAAELTFEGTQPPEEIPGEEYFPGVCSFNDQNQSIDCSAENLFYMSDNEQVKVRVCDNCAPTPLCDEEIVKIKPYWGVKNYIDRTWRNEDSESGGFQSMEIEYADEPGNQLLIHVYDICDGTNCQAGTAPMVYDGPNPMTAVFELEWGTVTLTIDPTFLDLDFEYVYEVRHYNDGRPDTTAWYNFY